MPAGAGASLDEPSTIGAITRWVVSAVAAATGVCGLIGAELGVGLSTIIAGVVSTGTTAGETPGNISVEGVGPDDAFKTSSAAELAGKGEGERTHVGLARSASGLAAVKRSTNLKPSLPAAAGSHLREGHSRLTRARAHAPAVGNGLHPTVDMLGGERAGRLERGSDGRGRDPGLLPTVTHRPTTAGKVVATEPLATWN